MILLSSISFISISMSGAIVGEVSLPIYRQVRRYFGKPR
jgi:hypothetical protein